MERMVWIPFNVLKMWEETKNKEGNTITSIPKERVMTVPWLTELLEIVHALSNLGWIPGF